MQELGYDEAVESEVSVVTDWHFELTAVHQNEKCESRLDEGHDVNIFQFCHYMKK